MPEEKTIDIEKIIASKNAKALKWTPRFVIRYLKKILHQDEINDFLLKNQDKKNVEWCLAVMEYMNITVDVKNIEKIPAKGKIVMALNHPLGGMDAIILVAALQSRREDMKFIVNDILMNLKSMEEMFVGVDKHGKNRVTLRQQIINLFKSDSAVCIFPAGLVSRKSKGNIRDLHWKKTFVTYAKEYDRTIIPIYVDGKLSNFFYRLANLRKFFRIKMNIEMLYLSNELFKQKNGHMNFVVGDPILPEMLKSKSEQDMADEIKERVYQLQNQL